MYLLNRLLLLALLLPTAALAEDVQWLAKDFGVLRYYNHNGSTTAFDIDATNDAITSVFQCNEACAITGFGYRHGIRTGTPCSLTGSLQGVSGAGVADGTIKTAGATSVNWTPPADATINNTIQEKTFGSSYTCTRGELLALHIGDTTGSCTPDGSNKSSIGYTYSNLQSYDFPYINLDNGGSVTRANGYGSMYYFCGGTKYLLPVTSYDAQDFGSDSSFDEYGNLFPGSIITGTTEQIAGARWRGAFYPSNKAFTVSAICDGTTVGSFTGDSDQLRRTDGGFGNFEILFTNVSLTSVPSTATCYITLRCGTTGTSCSIFSLTNGASADLAGRPGGTAIYGAKRADLGSWTAETNKRYAIEPIIRNITASGSSGPKQNQPGSGGMQ